MKSPEEYERQFNDRRAAVQREEEENLLRIAARKAQELHRKIDEEVADRWRPGMDVLETVQDVNGCVFDWFKEYPALRAELEKALAPHWRLVKVEAPVETSRFGGSRRTVITVAPTRPLPVVSEAPVEDGSRFPIPSIHRGPHPGAERFRRLFLSWPWRRVA